MSHIISSIDLIINTYTYKSVNNPLVNASILKGRNRDTIFLLPLFLFQ